MAPRSVSLARNRGAAAHGSLDGDDSAASALFGAVPFGMTPWEYTAWWQSGGGRELAHALYRPLGVEPILDLGLRLGEGTGAALAMQIVGSAVAAHNEMATFAEAGVSGKTPSE